METRTVSRRPVRARLEGVVWPERDERKRARRSGSFTSDRGGSKERRKRVGNNQRGRDDGDGRGEVGGEAGSFLRGW